MLFLKSNLQCQRTEANGLLFINLSKTHSRLNQEVELNVKPLSHGCDMTTLTLSAWPCLLVFVTIDKPRDRWDKNSSVTSNKAKIPASGVNCADCGQTGVVLERVVYTPLFTAPAIPPPGDVKPANRVRNSLSGARWHMIMILMKWSIHLSILSAKVNSKTWGLQYKPHEDMQQPLLFHSVTCNLLKLKLLRLAQCWRL